MAGYWRPPLDVRRTPVTTKMTVTPRYRRIAVVLAIVATAILCAVYFVRDVTFLYLIRPGNSAPAPVASDINEDSASVVWLRRPDFSPPGAWETPWGVDVFFVHPTTAIWSDGAWNADVDSTGLNEAGERVLRLYADGLSGAGALYAPAYRQAVLHALLTTDEQGAGALDVAYQDVLAAFDAYLAEDNRYRAIILVGVEQGALHVARLLQDRFAEGGLTDRLGAAYLLDVSVSEDDLPVPVCSSADETGCALAWVLEERAEMRAGPADGVCVNPLTWRRDETLAPAADHSGGVVRFDYDGSPLVIEQSVSAQCVNGALRTAERPASLQPNLWWGWGQRYRPEDFNTFFLDLAANVATRARAISARLDATGRKPAKPLPPVSALEDAPIHRQDGQAAPLP